MSPLISRFCLTGATSLALLTAACNRPAEETVVRHFEPVVAKTPELSLTSTSKVVRADQIKLVKDRFVEVDLNSDGMKDLAVVEDREPLAEPAPDADPMSPSDTLPPATALVVSSKQITVYIRKSEDEYYVGGSILEVDNAEIIGIAYRKSIARLYDIVLVYRHEAGHTEVVKYENDGHRLRRRDATDISQVAPTNKP